MAKYTDWYIDPTYSNTPTLWHNGFAMCLVDHPNGQWSVQAYDERGDAFRTGEPVFEMSAFESVDEAKSAAESKIVEMER